MFGDVFQKTYIFFVPQKIWDDMMWVNDFTPFGELYV